MKRRFHVFGLAHVPVDPENCICPFTSLIVNMLKMLRRAGHETILYAPAGSDASLCDEFVEVVSRETLEKTRTTGSRFNFGWTHRMEDPDWAESIARGRVELRKRYRREDISLIGYGWFQRFVAEESELAVEFMAGYSGTFHQNIVFPSHAFRYTLHPHHDHWPEWNHTVIPHFLDADEWAFAPHPEEPEHLAFLGRLVAGKGPDIAADVAAHAGLPLVVAGREYDADGLPGFLRGRRSIHYVGTLGHADRVVLLREAMAAIFPTRYAESFGMTTIEAMACGTPILTSNFGSMSEINVDGLTGYRCHDLDEFVEGVDKARKLDRRAIRDHFERTYSLEAVWPRFERYFERCARHRWHGGWYARKRLQAPGSRLQASESVESVLVAGVEQGTREEG